MTTAKHAALIVVSSAILCSCYDASKISSMRLAVSEGRKQVAVASWDCADEKAFQKRLTVITFGSDGKAEISFPGNKVSKVPMETFDTSSESGSWDVKGKMLSASFSGFKSPQMDEFIRKAGVDPRKSSSSLEMRGEAQASGEHLFWASANTFNGHPANNPSSQWVCKKSETRKAR